MLRSHLTLSLRGIVLIAMLSCGAAFAEEVQIGHLETKDDTGINWLYFRCENPPHGEGATLVSGRVPACAFPNASLCAMD